MPRMLQVRAGLCYLQQKLANQGQEKVPQSQIEAFQQLFSFYREIDMRRILESQKEVQTILNIYI